MQLTAHVQNLATPRLQAILAGLEPTQRQALLGRLGKELERQLKAHFTARDAEGNRRGFRRSHFWSRTVRAKTALREVTPDSATVGIASAEFAHKVTGGTIRPGPGRKALAIPLVSEAAGVLPRSGTIDGIFLLKTPGGAYLARREGKGFRALRLYWKLVGSVTHDADPRALPPVAQLQRALEYRAEAELARLTAQ